MIGSMTEYSIWSTDSSTKDLDVGLVILTTFQASPGQPAGEFRIPP